MFIKPKPGLKVWDPKARRHMPVAGMEVPDGDTYWVRRLVDGDVLIAQPPKGKE